MMNFTTVEELKTYVMNLLETVDYEVCEFEDVYSFLQFKNPNYKKEDVLFTYSIPYVINGSENEIYIYSLKGEDGQVYASTAWFKDVFEYTANERLIDSISDLMLEIARREINVILGTN